MRVCWFALCRDVGLEPDLAAQGEYMDISVLENERYCSNDYQPYSLPVHMHIRPLFVSANAQISFLSPAFSLSLSRERHRNR